MVVAGWAVGSAALVRMVPGSVAMGFNTALGLIAAGIWLLMRRVQTAGGRRVRIGLALFLIALFALILFEHIFGIDLGVDWQTLHQRVPDQNRLPGRVAPNTSIALMMCGAALLLRDLDFRLSRSAARFLGFFVSGIGLTGLVGYALDLEWLYRWYRLNRMALPTAAAVSLLGTAILLETRQAKPFRVRDADKLIVGRGVATLSLLAIAFALTGFVVLRESIEHSVRNNLLQTAQSDRALILSSIEQHARMAKMTAASPALIESVISSRRFELDTGDAENVSVLDLRSRYMTAGFSRFDIYDASGAMLVGQPALREPVLRIKLERFGNAAELIWRNGFLLSHHIKLAAGDRTIGWAELEQPLSGGFPTEKALGKTGERRLCAQLNGRLRCFPSLPRTAALDLPLTKNRQPAFPVVHAILNGETGVTTAHDYQGRPVLAAYVPVEPGVLGLVIEQEVDELFAPLRQRLALLLGLVLLLVAGAAIVLRSTVRPLASKLLHAETTAREQAAALRASMQALRDASNGLRESERQVRALNSELEHRVIERTADLTRANDDLRQFAYAASHDLQEPLRNIALFSQFVQRRYAGQLEQGGIAYLDLIAQNAQRMQRLLSDVLEYTKAGETSPGHANSDANAALDEALANLHATIAESGAQIERGALPSHVGAHAAHLVQILQNLIGNAIKYRSASAPRVRIEARRDGNQWIFSVRDNGIGIEKQYIEQIFGVFRRLHKNEYPGTGIGLAICQKIVQRYDGSIRLESTPGEGTTFYFSLPAAPDA